MFNRMFFEITLLVLLTLNLSSIVIAQDEAPTPESEPVTQTEILQPPTPTPSPVPALPEKADNANQVEEKSIDSFIGISYIPKANWSYPKFLNYENEKLKLSIDKNSFLTYDANVRFNKLQTVLGLNAITKENTISGKIHQISGYIGIKKMYFRLMKGKIAGDATWNAPTATNMPSRFDFDNSISSYDALYSFSDPAPTKENTNQVQTMHTGFYIGLGYTKGEVPATIRTLITTGGKVNQKYGNFVYDKDYSFSIVSFLFGFDTITGTILANGVVAGTIQPYFSCYDRIGYGSGTVSDESVRYAEELNPGKTFVDKKGKLFYVENSTSMGASWTPSFLKGKAIMALGYNLFFNSIMPMSGAAETSTELGYDANVGMLRHGPELRIFGIW